MNKDLTERKLRVQVKRLESLLRAIVADVEAMRVDREDFGFFSENLTHDDGNVEIKWPNLAILIDEAKKTLGQK